MHGFSIIGIVILGALERFLKVEYTKYSIVYRYVCPTVPSDAKKWVCSFLYTSCALSYVPLILMKQFQSERQRIQLYKNCIINEA